MSTPQTPSLSITLIQTYRSTVVLSFDHSPHETGGWRMMSRVRSRGHREEMQETTQGKARSQGGTRLVYEVCVPDRPTASRTRDRSERGEDSVTSCPRDFRDLFLEYVVEPRSWWTATTVLLVVHFSEDLFDLTQDVHTQHKTNSTLLSVRSQTSWDLLLSSEGFSSERWTLSSTGRRDPYPFQMSGPDSGPTEEENNCV